MRPDINTRRCLRSFLIGFIILTFTANLLACGPGDSTSSEGQDLTPGELSVELTPGERENVDPPLRNTRAPE